MTEARDVVVISSAPPRLRTSLAAALRHKDLLMLLVMRDVKLRYRTPVVGVAWAVLQPLLSLVVLSVFASALGIPSERVPYPLFLIAGLVPWTFISHAMFQSTHSLVGHGEIMSKVYFPRILVPVAAVLGSMGDFVVAAALIPAFLLYFGIAPGLLVLTLPLLVAFAVLVVLGIGLWLSVLNVYFRDVANTLPFVTQLLFFATPISYPASVVPAHLRWIVGLNPVAGVVEGFRWALFGKIGDPLPLLTVVSFVTALLMFGGGVAFVLRKQDRLVDAL